MTDSARFAEASYGNRFLTPESFSVELTMIMEEGFCFTMSNSSMRCSMTGIEIRDSGDGIWDDGEWISWVWINQQLAIQEGTFVEEEEIESDEEMEDEEDEQLSLELLNRIYAAKNHYENTLNEISPDWGSIGETYVAERFGVRLSRPHTEGHDGRLGDELIEIKTITPHKKRAFVSVKRAGNFGILAVVRVTDDYRLDARFIRRDQLPPGDGGKRAIISWETLCRLGKERPPG